MNIYTEDKGPVCQFASSCFPPEILSRWSGLGLSFCLEWTDKERRVLENHFTRKLGQSRSLKTRAHAPFASAGESFLGGNLTEW